MIDSLGKDDSVMKQLISKHYLFIILIIINVLFAIFFGGDFGDSYDEEARYDYAMESIERYSNFDPNPIIGDKGPIYFVFAKLGGDLIRLLNPGLSNIQAWHHIHFLSFILAIVAFYSICLHFLTPDLAFITSVLFNTQPLLFGHAFINPKDIPFLSLFLLTIASGLTMVTNLKCSKKDMDEVNLSLNIKRTIVQDWSKLGQKQKIITYLLIIPLLWNLLLIILAEKIQLTIQSVINNLNHNWAYNFLNKIAQSIFSGEIGNGISIQNAKTVYPYILVFSLLTLLLFILVLSIIYYPKSFGVIMGFSSRKDLFRGFSVVLKNKWVYLSGLILGFSITNRSLGVTAGGFILFYLWVKNRSKFIATSISYLGFSFIVAYFTWPGLWANPILGIFKSIFRVSTFSWGGKVLFLGETISPNNLPAIYFPTLMAIQFTIPALILFFVGIATFLKNMPEDESDTTLFIIFITWFILPLLAIMILNPTIYDNFRHFLFITPPIFLFSGLGLKFILSKIRNKTLSMIFVLAILLPGIIGIINLHPYQYIYYNSIIGGVEGAFRRFETDYWYTSYYECTKYINQVASINDTILVTGPAHIVEYYAREDLTIVKYDKNNAENQFSISDFAIISSRGNKDLYLLSDELTIYTVNESGATLAVVRKINQ